VVALQVALEQRLDCSQDLAPPDRQPAQTQLEGQQEASRARRSGRPRSEGPEAVMVSAAVP
jgi:hypothetical protein